MNGKGSSPRPLAVSLKEFDKNFDTIFGKKEKKEQYVPPPLPNVSNEKKNIQWQSGDTK